MFERFTVPKPSTAVSWIALIVALGGTAVAAGSTIVSIADKSGTRVVNVDGLNRLRVAASPAAPNAGFSTYQYVLGGTYPGGLILGASQATVVLTGVTAGNYYDQYNKAIVRIILTQITSSTANCTSGGSGRTIGVYYVAAGESHSDSFPAGLVLKPATAGGYWCLYANAYLQGNPSTYYLPELSVTGYVESGSFAAPSTVASTASGAPQLVRR